MHADQTRRDSLPIVVSRPCLHDLYHIHRLNACTQQQIDDASPGHDETKGFFFFFVDFYASDYQGGAMFSDVVQENGHGGMLYHMAKESVHCMGGRDRRTVL